MGTALALVTVSASLAGGADPAASSAAASAAATALTQAIASAAPTPGDTGIAPTPGDPSASAADPGASVATAPAATPAATPAAASTPAPTAAPAAATSPPTTITPPTRAATADAAVPSSVLASLSGVPNDVPTPYTDGCHVGTGGSLPSKACLYGHTSSSTTIALYGDSHAVAWFPALLRVVNDRGWRLLSVTMSGCVPADIAPYNTSTRSISAACVAFRKAAIARMTKYHPAVIVVAGTRGFETIDSTGRVLTGTARTTAWIAGMKRTLAKLIPISSRVVMLADTPNSRFSNPAGCVAANPKHELACATPLGTAINNAWLNTEYGVALAKHVAFIDATRAT